MPRPREENHMAENKPKASSPEKSAPAPEQVKTQEPVAEPASKAVVDQAVSAAAGAAAATIVASEVAAEAAAEELQEWILTVGNSSGTLKRIEKVDKATGHRKELSNEEYSSLWSSLEAALAIGA